jgi:hypothetical protein
MYSDLPEEGIDFQFIETDDSEVNARSRNPVVEIINESLYTGVIVQYGKINFHIDEVPPKLQFDFVILESGIHDKEKLRQDSQFNDYLGDIIVSTVQRMSEELQNENRDNDSEGAH